MGKEHEPLPGPQTARSRLLRMLAWRRDALRRQALLNLDDAFLNAVLQHRYMLLSLIPLVQARQVDPTASALWGDAYFTTDHARLERTFITFLYVLIEAWEAPANAEVKRWIQEVAPCQRLTHLLRQMRRSGLLKQMRETRDYMCHRDQRAFDDVGRFAVLGGAQARMDLLVEFGLVMRAARAAIPEAPR